MKVGLFGGSFNPPHIGHLVLMKSILFKNLVDEIWVFTHKQHFRKKLIPLRLREKMIKILLKEADSKKIKFISGSKVSFDISSPSSFYIYREFQKQFPNTKFYFVGGSDLLSEIKNWENPEKVKSEIDFLIVSRKGFPIKKEKKSYLYLKEDIPGCSSTAIRESLKNKNYDGKFLTKEIFKFIQDNGLDTFLKIC